MASSVAGFTKSPTRYHPLTPWLCLPPLQVTKIQAAARGKKARKEAAAKKAAREAEAEADGVVLSEYTTEDQQAVVKIQANARGFLARKKVTEKKAQINRYTGAPPHSGTKGANRNGGDFVWGDELMRPFRDARRIFSPGGWPCGNLCVSKSEARTACTCITEAPIYLVSPPYP